MIPASDLSYYIISLGCSKNQTDSERLNGGLLSAGFTHAPAAEDADIVIVNTCGFIEDAKAESIDVILDAADLSDGPSVFPDGRKLVVTGCLSQRYREDLQREMKEIDLVYGITDENLVPEICERFGIRSKRAVFSRELLLPSPFEYIKIAEGCSNNCSYCAIPLIRGSHISAPVDEVLRDAQTALGRGARELVIIAQDIAAYSHNGEDLYSLVSRIASSDGDFWIRLLYCHPDRIDERIQDIFTDIPKVVPYIDVPLQHVDRDILASMNRRGDYDTYKNLIRGLRERVPGIAVRSTFMVGYPGETDEKFEKLMRFVLEVPLDRGGVFRYSPEEGTKAYGLGDVPDEETVVQRYNRLTQAMEEGFRTRLSSRIGSRVRVLVEEQTGEAEWIGRSVYDAPEVDGVFYLTGGETLINSIVDATVTDTLEFDLAGEL
ncbi:MAG: 30S ribosomal protein S12 methylthiotransferase RimO [Spirochaetota bacterium]